MTTAHRRQWLRLALLGALAAPLCHIVVLVGDGLNPITSPISDLSRGNLRHVQTAGLVLFGVAHLALAFALSGVDRGRLWPIARALLIAGAVGQGYIAYFFLTAPETALYGPNASDPLWIIASLSGTAMGALQPGLARQTRRLGIFSVLVLGIWLWLVPLALLVNEHWLGLYERIVGVTYVIWLAGVSYGLLRRSSLEQAQVSAGPAEAG